jgi:hypothetical protein
MEGSEAEVKKLVRSRPTTWGEGRGHPVEKKGCLRPLLPAQASKV